MSAVWSSVIAVVGTLAGGLLAGVVQLRGSRVERREARHEVRRGEALAAVTALAVALAEHRRATWVAQVQRLSGEPDAVVAEAVANSHDTWSAVTAPLVTVKVLAPTFVDAAEAVTDAIYAMVGAPNRDTLEDRRDAARAAEQRLLREAGSVFAAVSS